MAHPRLDEVLDGALDLEPSEWSAYLDDACAGDRDLREEVESLLGVHVAHPDLLQTTPLPMASIPERIGRYPVRREIARGGMGIVYEAHDTALDRTIALKVLPARLAGDPVWLRRFEREARHLASMDHPNVANVYTLEESDGVHFLTMEFVADSPLRERLESGALSLRCALYVGTQIARALETLHRKDIAHCDLKPDNVLLSPEDHVTLIDFGLARRRAGATDARARSDSEVRTGTPGYMAPEQIEGRALDPRTDLWAFGCVAYECVTGDPAFEGDARERIARTLEGEPDWNRLPPELPPRIREQVRQCLEKDMDRRPASITEIRRAFAQELDALGFDHESSPIPRPHNLPQWPNVFIGRTADVDALAKRLDRTRLLTLIGAGGSGKTRLATHVARRRLDAYADGIRFVDLTATTSDEQALLTIAATCDIPVDPLSDTLDTLVDGLRTKSFLLVLDNCEHRLGACREITTRLLADGPGIAILATSREALGAPGESVHAVTPLLRPDPDVDWNPRDLAEVDSVALFLARTAETSPDFRLTPENAAAVADVCRRLEGLPLAIELAATHAGDLSEAGSSSNLLARLAAPEGGDESSGGRTVHRVIAWSYELLAAAEQAFFRTLAVFAGSFSWEAVAAVCAGDAAAIREADVPTLLERLRRKSLVELDVRARPLTGDVRFRLLEPIREFAVAALAPEEIEALRRRHSRFFIALAERAAPLLKGPEQNAWLSALASEHDNVRAALERCAAGDEEPHLGLRLAAALETFWTLRGHWKEADRFTRAMLERPGAEAPTAARGHTLNAAALCALNAGDPERADRLYDEALAIGNEIGDEDVVARSTHNKGGVALGAGRLADARRWFEEYLAMQRRRGNRAAEVLVLNNLGLVAEREQRLDDAVTLYEEALEIADELGNLRMAAVLRNNLGAAAIVRQRFDDARAYLERALEIHRDAEDRWGAATSQNLLGEMFGELGHEAAAKRHFHESLRTMDELGHAGGIATVLTQIGCFAVRWGEPERTATLLAAADAHRTRVHLPLAPNQQSEVEAAIEAARESLGDDAFRAHWGQGAALDTAEAVAFALR